MSSLELAALDGSARELRFRPSGGEACARCGSVFTDSSRLCRICGAERGAGPAAASAPGAGLGEAGTVGAAGTGGAADAPVATVSVAASSEAFNYGPPGLPQPALLLQLSILFGGYWLTMYTAFTLVAMFLKGLWFDYPPGWRSSEFALLVLLAAAQAAQERLGTYGNKAQCAASLAAFVALNSPIILVVGYFAGMQVYVLNVEYTFGLATLVLAFLRGLLGFAAALRCWVRRRDLLMLLIGLGFAATAAPIVLLILYFPSWSADDVQALYVFCWNVGVASCIGAMLAMLLTAQDILTSLE